MYRYQNNLLLILRQCRGHPGIWSAEVFSTSPLKPLNGIQLNLRGSKILASSTKFMFLGPIGKQSRLLISWDIFDFSPETAERNSTKLNKKQRLNVLYLVGVFQDDEKTKIAAMADLSKYGTLYSMVHDKWPSRPLVLFLRCNIR